MSLTTWALVIVATGAVLPTAWWARRYRWLWGRVAMPPALVGATPYRMASVPTSRPRGVPLGVQVASVTSIVWGLLTGLVFAPAGLIFAFFAIGAHPLPALALLAVAVHGFVLTVRLCSTAKALLRRQGYAVAQTARVSAKHHVAVTGACAVAAIAGEPGLLFLALVPCAVGFIHAMVLWSLAATMVRRTGQRASEAFGPACGVSSCAHPSAEVA